MNILVSKADEALRLLIPAYREKRKYDAELNYWRGELNHLGQWFNGERDWWGISSPNGKSRISSDLWSVNAVMTMHDMRPSYTEELKIERSHFAGQRVLEIGCGPLVPILQFTDCERYGIDPLIEAYMSIGWPLYAYDAKLTSSPAESMPYADSFFDSVISVNALDHVDDFEKVASEMQRVLKPGGRIYFEVEYHAPALTEPVSVCDARVLSAFSQCQMKPIIKRTGREMFKALIDRFDLDPRNIARFSDEEQFVTWHGVRK